MRQVQFDEAVAAGYDETAAEQFDPAVLGPAVDFLAALAGAGPVLEFAVGTGRVALPLAARGIAVYGIDLSPHMLARLRAKPGSENVPVVEGDMASTALGREFSLVYLVWNTIMNLTTQDEQVSCFENAARHLSPGSAFVVEVMVPDLQRLPRGETVRPFLVSPERFGFDQYDVTEQRLVSHHYWVRDGEARSEAFAFRYAWPAELDLMARLAGLALRERWGGWRREPFTAESESHVSVWVKPAG